MKKVISDDRVSAIIEAAQAYAAARHGSGLFADFTETEVFSGLACALISRDAILRTDRNERGATWEHDIYNTIESAGLMGGDWERTMLVYDMIVRAWCGEV